MSNQLLKGNVAIAEAAIRAGCEAYFGYPITPQTELLEHMSKRMVELGREELWAGRLAGPLDDLFAQPARPIVLPHGVADAADVLESYL